MSLFRRLSRDRLQEGDVVPYHQDHQEPEAGENAEPAASTCRGIELRTLDLVELGPYLLVAVAREKAEALSAAARAEAEKLRNAAVEEGIAGGREEGKREVLPSAVAFANAGQALIVFEEQMIAHYTPEMVRLALAIAEKIVHKVVAEEPTIVASVLERARQEVLDARRIYIHLNPADHEVLAEMRPDLLKLGNDKGRVIEVVADEDLSRGGCRLETEIGVVDATIPTQIAEVRRQLLDEEVPKNGTIVVQPPSVSAGVGREL
jgi:flagellar assembly protein FliH